VDERLGVSEYKDMKPLIHRALFLMLISLAGASYAQVPQIKRDALIALYFLTMSAEAGNFDARQELHLNLGWTENEVNTQADRIPRCTSFGFEEGTDGHANCVMELQIAEDSLAQARQLAEGKQNEINQLLDGKEDAHEEAAAINATQRPAAVARENAARRYQEQQQREREAVARQRTFGGALLGIGSGLLNPRTPSNSGDMFQICYYNVLEQIVPYAISSAQICPPTRNFDGTGGILQ
jgi:hypothetical protein